MKWDEVKETNRVKLLVSVKKGEYWVHGEVSSLTNSTITICGFVNKDLATLDFYTFDRKDLKSIDRTRLAAETSKRVSNLVKQKKDLELLKKEREVQRKKEFKPKIVTFGDLEYLIMKKLESDDMALPYFNNNKLYFKFGYGGVDPGGPFKVKQEYDGFVYLKDYKESDVKKVITKELNKKLIDDYYLKPLTAFGKIRVKYTAEILDDFKEVEGAGVDICVTYEVTLRPIKESEVNSLYNTFKDVNARLANSYRLYTM